MITQILEMFANIQTFLEKNSDVGAAYCPKSLAILPDPTKNAHLKVELATIVDAGKQLLTT